MLDQFASYLYIPYQFLQLMGYRLVGKPCHYQWRKYGVKPIGPITPKQRLVGGLFPVAVFWVIVILQAILYVYLHYLFHTSAPWIPVVFGLLSSLGLGSYFYLVIFDVLRTWRFLKQAHHHPDSKVKEPPQSQQE